MHVPVTILALSSLLVTVAGQLETVYEWRYVDYTWPSQSQRQQAVRSGDYNITEPLPMDVAVSQDGRVFITLVSITGVPARLAEVTNRMEFSGPLLRPYPSWDWTDKISCDAILKPYRIEIDKCNRLWVLDSASNDHGQPRHCHPKLLAFDLWTDTLLTKLVLPENIASNARTNQSLMTNVRVETHGQFCEDTTVYMTDSAGNALVIWDGTQLYRIEDPTFYPRSEASGFTIGSETSNMTVGILGMDVSPRIFPNEPQYLYFRPMSSTGMFAVSIDQLKNGIHGQPIEIFGTNDVLSSQSIVHAFSSEGVLFLSPVKEISLVCWNRYRKLSKENIVTISQDSKRLQYADGIKIIPRNVFGEEEVWMITNRLVHHDRRNVWDPKEVNFRILKGSVERLIAGTKCQTPIEIRHQQETLHDMWDTHLG